MSKSSYFQTDKDVQLLWNQR